jgi:hypothetical protein
MKNLLLCAGFGAGLHSVAGMPDPHSGHAASLPLPAARGCMQAVERIGDRS